jgi:hypothetical protein
VNASVVAVGGDGGDGDGAHQPIAVTGMDGAPGARMPSQTRSDADIGVAIWRGRLVWLFAGAIAVAVVAACDASPRPPATSLAGPTACEGMTCGSGQICQLEVAVDAGIQAFCVDPPAGCEVTDCYGYGSGCSNCTCPDCLARLCGYYPGVPTVEVEGRTITCPSY